MKYEEFFGQGTRSVAQELLGRLIIRKLESGVYAALISETGAYEGLAGADRSGPRKGMFYKAGNIFLMDHRGHKLFNIASGSTGPACIEIRELRGERRIEGPGAITNFLKATELDDIPLGDDSGIYISNDSYQTGKVVRSDGSAENCKGIYALS